MPENENPIGDLASSLPSVEPPSITPPSSPPAPPAPPVKAKKKARKKTKETKAVAKRPDAQKLIAHAVEDLAPELQREPATFADAVKLVAERQEATGSVKNFKQARRAAAMAWPALHEMAGKPRV